MTINISSSYEKKSNEIIEETAPIFENCNGYYRDKYNELTTKLINLHKIYLELAEKKLEEKDLEIEHLKNSENSFYYIKQLVQEHPFLKHKWNDFLISLKLCQNEKMGKYNPYTKYGE